MLNKLIIFVLLNISIIQAFPSSNVESDNTEPACVVKIAWYRDINNNTKGMYDAYNVNLTETKLQSSILNKLNIENVKFENTMAEMLKRYDTDTEKLNSIDDSTAKETFCQKNIDDYKRMNRHLSESAMNLKANAMDILDNSNVSKIEKDQLDRQLSKIVNFLFIADMTKNKYKELLNLASQSFKTTNHGIAMEKEWKMNENDQVEPVHDIDADYEKLLDSDDEIIKAQLEDLEDDSEIRAAEERALERVKNRDEIDNDHDGIVNLGLGIASLMFIVLAILVGSVLVWLRSRSYSRF